MIGLMTAMNAFCLGVILGMVLLVSIVVGVFGFVRRATSVLR